MTGNCSAQAGRRETIIMCLGRLANPSGIGGMPAVDCLGESRMKENFMSGLGRGCWRRSGFGKPSADLGSVADSHQDDLIEVQLAGCVTAPASYFTTAALRGGGW